MTEELKHDRVTRQERQQRFLRVSLLIVMVLMALIDLSMFIFGVTPNNWIILIMLVPVAVSVRLAFLGKSSQAGWWFAGANIFGVFAETLGNPRSPLDLDVLISQFLPTILLVIPVALWGLENKKQRRLIIWGSILGAIIAGFIGHALDQGSNPEVNPVFTTVANSLWILALIVLNYFFIRNFATSVRWYLNLPLRTKLITSMAAVVVFGTAAVTIVQAVQSANQLRDSISSALQSMADRQADEIGQIVSSRLEVMHSLTVSSSVIDFLNQQNASYSEMREAEILAEMERLDASWERAIDNSRTVRDKLLNDLANEAAELKTLSQGEFLEVFFTDKYGGLAGASDRTSDYYQADEGWWQAAYDNGYGAGYVGQMEFDESTNSYAVNMAIPVYGRDTREVIGVMRITFDMSSALQLMAMRAEEIGESVELEIVFGDGNHVHEGVLDEVPEDAFAALKAWSPSDQTLAWDGGNNYVGIALVNSLKFPQIAQLDWKILATQDVEVVANAIQTMILTSVGIGLVVILAGVAFAGFLGQTISSPVKTLTEIAKKFSGGDYSVQAEVNSEDEIGQLAAAFNQMAVEVGSQTVALAERAREMEASQRVTFAASERTTPEDFLDLLVNLITDQFDVYHCQVYLVDEEKNAAVLSQSTGYAGRQLLQRGHAIPLDAQSLVTQCINTGESVLVAETTNDPNWLPNPLLPLTQSELVVPLKIDDKVIGAMDIQDRVPERFTSETVPVFESMTEHVAFLYENNELLEDIAEAQRVQEQFVSQLETTSEVAGQLTTILDPTHLLDQAVTMLQNRFNFYHAHIYLLDEAKQNLVVATGSGHVGVILKERGHNIPADAEKSFVARAFRAASPVRIADTTQDPNWLPNPLLPDTRAEMAVPLVTRGQVIGVLDIQDEVVGRFTEVDEDTMLTLAGQLATSVDTARLFVNVEQAAERDRTRFEIAEALSGNPTEDEVWDILLEKAMGESVAVSLNLAEFLEDGSVDTVTHRSASSDPKITASPVGFKFVVRNDPEYGILDFDEIFISNNVMDDARIRPTSRENLAEVGVVSTLTTPITISDEGEWSGGVIRVDSSQPDFFDENQISKYRTLIELGTVALRSARLRASIDAAAKRTATRLEVTQALAGNLTEDQVLDVLVEKAALYPEARIAIYYEDAESDVRTIVSQRDEVYDTGMVPMGVGTRISNDMMKFDNVLLKDEVVIVDNVMVDERLDEATKKAMSGVGYTSLATLPLQMSEDWVGYIFVTSKKEKTFDQEKITLYNILAEAGIVALRAARLRAAVESAAERDRTRLEIAEALSGNPTEDEVWDILLEKALGDNLMVGLSKIEQLEDGTVYSVTQRAESTNPALIPPKLGARTNLSQSGVLEMLRDGKIFSNDIPNDDHLVPELRENIMSLGIVSELVAPLGSSTPDEWQGIISVGSSQVGYFDETRIRLYDALIELGTVALRSAGLRAEADQERERFRVLIENAPEAIVVFNGETGEFMEANQNAVDLYEVPMDELIGNNPVAVSPELQPDGRPSADAAMGYIQEAIDGGTPVFDWLHRTGTGREIPCEIRLVRLPGYNNPPRLRGSIADISERAAAQQAIVQGDRLKSEFLANMSHELRTPLNSILGYTDVLLMGLDGELDEEVTTDLEAIHENSQHLLNLINDILDLAKIEAGRMTIELGDVNVSNLLQEVKKTSAGLLVNKDVEMLIDADEKLPEMTADYHRVYQVVNNLVSNAVKFTEKGSITLRAFDEGDEMVLQVEDTGIGISDEDLEVIFEEFTQADTSSTRQHEGTGLGLTITRRLVQMHGGTISVESEAGKGSTFTARFPMQAKVNPELLTVVQSSNGNK